MRIRFLRIMEALMVSKDSKKQLVVTSDHTNPPVSGPQEGEKSALIGGVGGAIAGSAAGALAGPVGAVIGGTVGAIAGSLAAAATKTVVDDFENPPTRAPKKRRTT